MHDLRDDRGGADGGGRVRFAARERLAQQGVAEALRLVAPADQEAAHQLDGRGIGDVEERQRGPGAEAQAFLAAGAQQVAHVDRDVAEVDVHRAGLFALVAHGAVVGDVVHLVEVADRDAAARLFLVQERLDDETGGQDLVARRVQQVGARHVRVAHRLALAAAQAVLDLVVERAQLARLQDQRLLLHQAQRRRVRAVEGRARQQLAAIEMAVGVDVAACSARTPRVSGASR